MGRSRGGVVIWTRVRFRLRQALRQSPGPSVGVRGRLRWRRQCSRRICRWGAAGRLRCRFSQALLTKEGTFFSWICVATVECRIWGTPPFVQRPLKSLSYLFLTAGRGTIKYLKTTHSLIMKNPLSHSYPPRGRVGQKPSHFFRTKIFPKNKK